MKKHIAVLLAVTLLLAVVSGCGVKAPTWQEQYDLGVRYLSEGKYEEAVIAFTAAIEIEPKQAAAFVGRGDAYFKIGKYDLAEADYSYALSLDPSLDLQDRIDEIKNLLNNVPQDSAENNSANQVENALLTYTTHFGIENCVDYPAFSFDYPSEWSIDSETVDEVTERVTISDPDGITVKYEYWVPEWAYGSMHISTELETEKIAESSFAPGFAQTRDYSDLGEFAVVKIRKLSWDDSWLDTGSTQLDYENYIYAVAPESYCGIRTVNENMSSGFYYDGLVVFAVDHADALTEEKTQEVIAILSSFRVKDDTDTAAEEQPSAEEILDDLRNGDFSYFAGIYAAFRQFDKAYQGMRSLPDITLEPNGVITGGGTIDMPDYFTGTAPLSVALNEDGAYVCEITDGETYEIYPVGVQAWYYDHFTKDCVRIRYTVVDGGVMDIVYYKK